MKNINYELMESFIKEVELKFESSSVFKDYNKELSMKENFLNFNKYLNSYIKYCVSYSNFGRDISMYIPNVAYVLYANGYSCKEIADFICKSYITFFIDGSMNNVRFGKSIDTDYLFSMLLSDMGNYYDTFSYFYRIKDEILNSDYKYSDIYIIPHYMDNLIVYQNFPAEHENIKPYVSLLKFISGINYKTYFVKADNPVINNNKNLLANEVVSYLNLDNEELIEELINEEFEKRINDILSSSTYFMEYFENVCNSYNCYPFQHLMSKDLCVIKEFLEMNIEEIKDDKIKDILKYIDTELKYRKSKGILL